MLSIVCALPFSLKLMQAEPHKLDFRSDPLARLPGAGGLGPLGTIGGGLPPTHELTRPPSLFPATGTRIFVTVPFRMQIHCCECQTVVLCLE